MPEPIFIRCAVCDETYDKVNNPRCPNCSGMRSAAQRSDRKPGESALQRAAREALEAKGPDSGPKPSPGAPPPGTRASAKPVVKTFTQQLEESGQAHRYAFVPRTPLMVAAGFALGLFVYPIAMNALLGQPLLGSPTLHIVQPAEVVTLKDRSTSIERVQVQVKLEARSIELLEWHREPGETDGTVKYVGKVRNASQGQLTKALVQVFADDLAGRELAKGWAWILPSVMQPGEEGTFEVEVEEHARTQNLRLTTAWNQYFKDDLADLDPRATTSYFADRPAFDGDAAPAEPTAALVASRS